MASPLPTFVDVQGCRLRLLVNTPVHSDRLVINSDWRLAETSVKSYLDDAQKVYGDIEALKKAQEVAPQSRESLEKEIMRREATRDKWHIALFQGLVFNKFQEIESLEKKALEKTLQLRDKDAEIGTLRRKAENYDKMLAEQSEVSDNDLTTTLLQLKTASRETILQIESTLRDMNFRMKFRRRQREAEKLEESKKASTKKVLEMERKLSDMALLMESSLKKGEADKLQLEDAHRRECEALRLEVQQQKGSYLERYLQSSWEALREAGIIPNTRSISTTTLQEGAPTCVYVNPSVKLEGNREGGHAGDVIQTKKDLEKQVKKRLSDTVTIAAQNVAIKPQGNAGTILGKGKRLKRKIQRYGSLKESW